MTNLPEDADALAHWVWDIEEAHLAARGFPAQGYTLMPERTEDGEQYPPVGDWVPPRRRVPAPPPPPIRRTPPPVHQPTPSVRAEKPWTPRGFKAVPITHQPLTLKPPPVCTAVGALSWWYPSACDQAERRITAGQKQGRCQTCMRWRWADEPCDIAVFPAGKEPVATARMVSAAHPNHVP